MKNKPCIAIARKTGLLQVYERSIQRDYKLVKEWRNCKASSSDRLISIGIINHQYLYSCSLEGRFVLRDMINDDEDNSNRLYQLSSPISCVNINVVRSTIKDDCLVQVAVSGRDNPVTLYDLNTNKDYDYEESAAWSKVFNLNTTELGRLRHVFCKHHENNLTDKLSPSWINPYKHHCGIGDEWIISIVFYRDLIICGNQFGFITFYNRLIDDKKVLKPSTFPITHLKIINHHLIYNDMISRIGIIDLFTNQEIHTFNYNFGPIDSVKYIINKPSYFPLVFIATTNEGDIQIIKLFRNNRVQLLYKLKFDSMITGFHIIRNKICS